MTKIEVISEVEVTGADFVHLGDTHDVYAALLSMAKLYRELSNVQELIDCRADDDDMQSVKAFARKLAIVIEAENG